jgi:hypothetical protein
MYMGEPEKINKFALKVTTNMNRIRSLGAKVEETTIIEKLLHSIPTSFYPREHHRAIGGSVRDDGDGDNQASASIRGVFKGAAV